MYYYQSIEDSNGYVYSCDKIRLEVKTDIATLEKLARFCASTLLLGGCSKYYLSLATFNYRHCFTFNLTTDISFSLLLGLNCYGRLRTVFIIEFNPNKCMDFQSFKDFISNIFYNCYDWNFDLKTQRFTYVSHIMHIDIKRYDIAVDFPYSRQNFFCFYSGKGAKLHETIQTTTFDRTDYFGERNSIGRVKVYNKSLEDIKNKSKKEKELYKKGFFQDISRVEVTHNTFDVSILYGSFPTVFTNFDLSYISYDCSPVDYILVSACRQDSSYIPYLKQSRQKWNKLKNFILSESINFDALCLSKVLSQIGSYSSITTYSPNFFEDAFITNYHKFVLPTITSSVSYFDDVIVDDDFEEIIDDTLKPF